MILKSTLLFNLPFGPWGGASWFQKMKEGWAEYMDVTSPNDPILTLIWQRHCRDTGDPSLVCDSEAFEEFIRGLRWAKTIQRKGTRVTLSRWFSWMDAAEDCFGRRHEILAVLLFLCVSQGLADHSRHIFAKDPWGSCAAVGSRVVDGEAACSPRPQVACVEAACSQHMAGRAAAACSQPVAATAKESTAHGQSDEDVNSLRRRCKNTLHASCVVAADDSLWTSVAQILVVVRAVHTTHRHHAHYCRSREMVTQWYAAQSAGPLAF